MSVFVLIDSSAFKFKRSPGILNFIAETHAYYTQKPCRLVVMVFRSTTRSKPEGVDLCTCDPKQVLGDQDGCRVPAI